MFNDGSMIDTMDLDEFTPVSEVERKRKNCTFHTKAKEERMMTQSTLNKTIKRCVVIVFLYSSKALCMQANTSIINILK